MLSNFINVKTKELFLEQLGAINILEEAIVFIEDTKEIWTHGNYYATQRTTEEIENIVASSETVQAVIEQISSKVASELDSAIKKEIPTKNSQLENDSNFFVKETSGDGTKFLSDNGDYKDLEHLWYASKYNWIDLGLPSGLKWATYNVGATSPEEYGLYFAWGETQGYAECTDTKRFVEEDYALLDHLDYHNIPYYKKYDPNVDNLTTLELSDDAAYLSDNLCRMPTLEDFEELANNTTGLWTYHGGILGLRLTSKINHKTIFIPAAGSCTYGSVYGSNESVSLWSSSLNRARGGQMFAYSYGSNKNWGTGGTTEAYRYAGLSIRPVLDSNKDTTLTPVETLSKINEINEKLEEVLYDSEITWQELKDLKDKTDLIETDGDGTKFLSDDGTYKKVSGVKVFNENSTSKELLDYCYDIGDNGLSPIFYLDNISEGTTSNYISGYASVIEYNDDYVVIQVIGGIGNYGGNHPNQFINLKVTEDNVEIINSSGDVINNSPYIWDGTTSETKFAELKAAIEDNRRIFLLNGNQYELICTHTEIQGNLFLSTRYRECFVTTSQVTYLDDSISGNSDYTSISTKSYFYHTITGDIIITFNPNNLGGTCEYNGEFTFEDTVYTVTFPEGITWITIPESYKPNTTYQFKILNNIGSVWEVGKGEVAYKSDLLELNALVTTLNAYDTMKTLGTLNSNVIYVIKG